MARTIKKGLDYFPFDVDMFQDIRIRKLIKYQGGKAITVYALLLCYIYRNGYYAEWDKELPFIISEQSGYEEAYIQEVIKSCLNIGLFSQELYESDKVLTSKGIQERYRRICTSSRRSSVISEYNLLPVEEKTQQQPAKPHNKTAAPKPRPNPIQPKPNAPVTPAPTVPPRQPKPYQKYSLTLEEEVAEFRKSPTWISRVCDRYGLYAPDEKVKNTDPKKQIEYWFNEYIMKCAKTHVSIQDASSHFCSLLDGWLRDKRKKGNSPTSPKDNQAADAKPDYESQCGFGGMDV